jgi:hypothetical protein
VNEIRAESCAIHHKLFEKARIGESLPLAQQEAEFPAPEDA